MCHASFLECVYSPNASEIAVLQVSAIDRDSGDTSIVYRLEGQGTDKFFSIDNRTGIISVMSRVDRDAPYGAPEWKFIVQVRNKAEMLPIKVSCRRSTTTEMDSSVTLTSKSL